MQTMYYLELWYIGMWVWYYVLQYLGYLPLNKPVQRDMFVYSVMQVNSETLASVMVINTM